jgi:type I restriction enzyme S subunit
MKQGWEMKRLDTVCTFINGKAYNKEELLNAGKYPVLRVGNFFTNNEWYYSDLELSEDKYCDNGDLLYAWSASFGPRIWSGEKVIYHYHIWKVIPDSKIITKEFLYHLLDWDVEKIKSDHGTGTTMMHVGKGSMDARVVPIPPIPEQHRIVSILDKAFAAIATAKTNAEQNFKNSKELFDSYLQGVFANRGEGWVTKTLGEVCKVERGSSPRPIDNFFTDNQDGVNWIKIGDTKNVDKYIYTTRQKITKEGALNSRFVDIDDFILSNSMSFGKPYIMKTQGYIHDGWFVLRLPKNIDTEFFWYLLASPYVMNQFITLSAGAIVKNISGDLVKKTVLPIPTLKQQQSIVQKLDALSAETKKLEAIYRQKVVDLEELKKSVLQKAFNGELS